MTVYVFFIRGGKIYRFWLRPRLVTFWVPTCWYHNFVTTGPILTILVPLESPLSWLPIGTKFVKIGPMVTKLWSNKVNNQCYTILTIQKPSLVNIGLGLRFFYKKAISSTFFLNQGYYLLYGTNMNNCCYFWYHGSNFAGP